MAENERKWWQKKTNWGLAAYGAGEVLIGAASMAGPMMFPVALAGWALRVGGTMLAGYGIVDRVSKR